MILPRLAIGSLILTLVLIGCGQPPASTPSPLPLPIVQVTHPVATLPPTLTPTSTSLPLPTASSDIQALALQTYGDRLIQTITIPALNIQSPVVTVGWLVNPDPFSASGLAAEWDSPGGNAGWVLTSALPDQVGNILIYGHNNMYGSLFKNLSKLIAGDGITLATGNFKYSYRVDRVWILPLLNAGDEARRAYQTYLAPTDAPRLTLISCWPPQSNTHRVVVIAYPDRIP